MVMEFKKTRGRRMKLVALITAMMVLFFVSGTNLVKATILDVPTGDCRKSQAANAAVTQRTYYEYVTPVMPLPLAIDKNQKALSESLLFGVTGTPINFGQTLSASIDMAAEMDTYTFSANTNDTVLIRMTKTSGTLWPGIRLFAPDGTELDQQCAPTTVEISYVLPSSGIYTILAYDCFNGNYTGSYNIYLQRLNAPGDPTPISSGQTLSASIDMAAEMDTYTFSANTNDTVLIRMTKTSGTLWPGIRLFAPDGTELDQQCAPTTVEISYVLPSTGIYTILACDCWSGSNTGTYNIYLSIITVGICGDVAPCPTSDGVVNMGDVVLLLNYVGHPGEYELCCEWCGDVAPCPTSDGVINMGDVVLLLNYVGHPGQYELCCG